MAVGMVRSFHEDEGYGFIETDEGEQFFVHHSAIEMEGFRTLSQGDRVFFEARFTRRGPRGRACAQALRQRKRIGFVGVGWLHITQSTQ